MAARNERVLGAVPAGGRSRRMGRPKPCLELAGRPLIGYPLAALEVAGIDAVVVAKQGSELPAVAVSVVVEPDEPVHPLVGVVAALEVARGRDVVLVACDMPLVSGELLAWLAELEGTAVPVVGGRQQPLLARYDGEALEPLRRALREELSMGEAVAALGPRWVGEGELAAFGDPQRLCFNVNAPEDLAEAERLLATDRPFG